jgi:Zn-dependent protease
VDLRTFLYLVPILVGSLTLHELAHGLVAWRLGDPTAKEQGRLTLNPIAHLDPLGTIMFAITAIAGVPFGWARPVPVNPRYFRRAREGMALVGAAGPATNFVIALVCLALYRHAGFGGETLVVLENAYIVNVVLGLFNLIPVPPLDGSRIVGVVMNDVTYVRWTQLDQYGMFVVFGLFFLFRNEFTTVLTSALDYVTRGMDVLVGA